MPMMRNRSNGAELTAHFGFVAGCTSEAIGRERSAIAFYRHEIRRTSYWKAHFNLARLLSKRSRLREAISHYEEAARRSARRDARSDALNNLGLLYSRKRARQKAIKAFRLAINANRRSSAPRVNLALELIRSSAKADGLQWLESAHRLRRVEPETDAWVGYVLVEYDLDVPRGAKLLELAVARSPENWRAMADLAVAQMKLGNQLKAASLAKRASRLAKGHPDVKRQLHRVLGVSTKKVSSMRGKANSRRLPRLSRTRSPNRTAR
jgi:tetratricopeptide (TPR) repeat protein